MRSVADGRVFDLVAPVADRYLQARNHRPLEIWKPNRRVRTVEAGAILRIQTDSRFMLHWTNDEWRTVRDTDSVATALGIHFIDVPVTQNQTAPLRFTFFWPEANRWEGTDYGVGVRASSVTGDTTVIIDQIAGSTQKARTLSVAKR